MRVRNGCTPALLCLLRLCNASPLATSNLAWASASSSPLNNPNTSVSINRSDITVPLDPSTVTPIQITVDERVKDRFNAGILIYTYTVATINLWHHNDVEIITRSQYFPDDIFHDVGLVVFPGQPWPGQGRRFPYLNSQNLTFAMIAATQDTFHQNTHSATNWIAFDYKIHFQGWMIGRLNPRKRTQSSKQANTTTDHDFPSIDNTTTNFSITDDDTRAANHADLEQGSQNQGIEPGSRNLFTWTGTPIPLGAMLFILNRAILQCMYHRPGTTIAGRHGREGVIYSMDQTFALADGFTFQLHIPDTQVAGQPLIWRVLVAHLQSLMADVVRVGGWQTFSAYMMVPWAAYGSEVVVAQMSVLRDQWLSEAVNGENGAQAIGTS